MIFSTITRLFFEANFENSFSAIAEKNTILVYLCAAFCQILMAISYTDFPKNLYFKCTMNLKLDHHTYKVNFSKKFLLVGLSSKNIFWMTRKKNPSHQKWWFLDFLLTNTRAFWLLHSYELALTEQSPLNLPKSRVHEASKKFSWPSRL